MPSVPYDKDGALRQAPGATSESLGQRPPGRTPNEQAATQKCPFECSVAMDASATEPGCLTHGVHPGQRRAVRPQRSTIEVGLQATKGLARQHMQPDSDQRAARPSPTGPWILRIE